MNISYAYIHTYIHTPPRKGTPNFKKPPHERMLGLSPLITGSLRAASLIWKGAVQVEIRLGVAGSGFTEPIARG